MNYQFSFSLYLLLIVSCNLLAQNKPVAILPFELKSDNRIYIKCSVNGTDSLTFLFDTGAEPMVINQSILGKKLEMAFDSETSNLGANGVSRVKVSTKNRLSFGGIVADSVRFVGIPYVDRLFDGVFGMAIMKRYLIEVDYNKRKMSFYNPRSYIYHTKDYNKLHLKFIVGVPTMKAFFIINGKKYKGHYELDTGGDRGLIIPSPFSNQHNLIQKLKTVAKAKSVGSDGKESKSAIVVIPEVGFGNKHFYRIPASLSTASAGVLANKELAGIYGNGFLKRFDMIIDLGHNQVFLKPNDYLHTPYYNFLIK